MRPKRLVVVRNPQSVYSRGFIPATSVYLRGEAFEHTPGRLPSTRRILSEVYGRTHNTGFRLIRKRRKR